MAKDWKKGDVVMFILGGPKMLVKRFTNPGGEQLQVLATTNDTCSIGL